jgi:hypothetical protein
MATIVISPCNVVNSIDVGGHFWVYMQYAQALRRLGCDVYWLERFSSSGDHNLDATMLETFFKRMDRYGLGGKTILYKSREPKDEKRNEMLDHREYIGLTAGQAKAVFRRADLLLNFQYAIDPALLSRFRRVALVDIDPGLLQFWMATGQLLVPQHDLYFSTGETVGKLSAGFPNCSLPWIHIRPPICLDLWPYAFNPDCEAFTTVSSWWGETDWITIDKKIIYVNTKRASFLEFVELPHGTSQVIELALFLGKGDEKDRLILESNGWRIRHSRELCATPEMYQTYIQQSRGEFSCAKPSCMKFQNAWISDRTLCYLASGKPVVVQNTGPSSFLPNGAGMFRFSTLEEAADALATINSAYERHCRVAREIAEAYFDARRILERILSIALGNHYEGDTFGLE